MLAWLQLPTSMLAVPEYSSPLLKAVARMDGAVRGEGAGILRIQALFQVVAMPTRRVALATTGTDVPQGIGEVPGGIVGTRLTTDGSPMALGSR